jgi:hypothetical protein
LLIEPAAGKGVLTIAFAFAPFSDQQRRHHGLYVVANARSRLLPGADPRPITAGRTFHGLAIGLLTAFWVAFAFIFWLGARNGSDRRCCLWARCRRPLAAYSPVLATHYLGMFNFYDAKVCPAASEASARTRWRVGALAVLAGLAISLPRLKRLPADLLANSHVALWVAVPVLVFGSFTRLPHEVAYLVPLFPFGFFLMARYFQRSVLVAVALLIVLSGFVDITSPGDEEVSRQTFTSAQIGAGMMLSDLDTLKSQRVCRRLDAVDIPPHRRLHRLHHPQFAMRNKGRLTGHPGARPRAISTLTDRGEAVDRENDIHYVWLLKYDAFEAFRERVQLTTYMTPKAATPQSSTSGPPTTTRRKSSRAEVPRQAKGRRRRTAKRLPAASHNNDDDCRVALPRRR